MEVKVQSQTISVFLLSYFELELGAKILFLKETFH